MPSPRELGPTVAHLRTSGVSLLIALGQNRMPDVVHWGADLGPLDAATAHELVAAAAVVHEQDEEPTIVGVDADGVLLAPADATRSSYRTPILAEHASAWPSRPGLSGSRAGRDWSPRFAQVRALVDGADAPRGLVELAGEHTLTVIADDEIAGLAFTLEIQSRASGLIRLRGRVRSTAGSGASPYSLQELSLRLAIPDTAAEAMDFTGRWSMERIPQRAPLVVGTRTKENVRGRPSADAAFLTVAGEAGFGFDRGQVWAVHLAWSGNSRQFVDVLPDGAQFLGAGEYLLPGEIELREGDEYVSPWVYAAYASGLDALARRFHEELRSWSTNPRSPRPVTVNSWEAVYFDHSERGMIALIDHAAEVGAERFVVDDGWFRGRSGERTALGDWYVDQVAYPRGLEPVARHAHQRGLQFGLWVEPEMISTDSDLARAHPDWILRTEPGLPREERFQQVLDLTAPGARDYILDRLTSLIDALGIDFLKWDHNRDLVDAGHVVTDDSGRIPAVHAQTRALYSLLDELRARYPDLEIESCSSGGGRIDLGILERAHRVWASDVLDPLERTAINAWTLQLVPPERIGSHIGSPRSHITGRRHDLGFRASAALLYSLGVEWDLASASPDELSELTGWVELHKRLRPLIGVGRAVRVEHPDDSLMLSGIVAPDRSHAVFVAAALKRPARSARGRLRFPGLNTRAQYRVRPLIVGAPPAGLVAPPWFGRQGRGVVLRGAALEVSGVRMPPLHPEQSLIVSLTSDPSPE